MNTLIHINLDTHWSSGSGTTLWLTNFNTYIWVVQTINISKNHLLDMLTYAKRDHMTQSRGPHIGDGTVHGKKNIQTVQTDCVCSAQMHFWGPLCLVLSDVSETIHRNRWKIHVDMVWMKRKWGLVSHGNSKHWGRGDLPKVAVVSTKYSTVTVNNHVMKSLLWREMSDSLFRHSYKMCFFL